MKLAATILVASVCSGAFASQPGQPLDCSDWAFLQPGFSCTIRQACDNTEWGGGCDVGSAAVHMDVASGLIRAVTVTTQAMCGRNPINRVEIVRDTGTRTVIGYLDDRCVDPTTDRIDGFTFQLSAGSLFDASKGQLIFPGGSYSIGTNPTPLYATSSSLYAIEGFATTFDVLQTYTPQASLGFRVPYMPEGLAGADHFDTYWGPLTKPLDFAQAHPLRCDYPAAPPHVGDYLAVPDTVPTPLPGHGVYYVTSATYQGATRYGRQTANARMAGRDPALLPACTP